MSIPQRLLYTKEHLWVQDDGNTRKAGLTHFAQELIGEISYVDLPQKGSRIDKGRKLITIEGLKSVIDITAPYTLTVLAVNEALVTNAALVNKSPYDEGWILEVSPPGPDDAGALLSAADYRTAIGQ